MGILPLASVLSSSHISNFADPTIVSQSVARRLAQGVVHVEPNWVDKIMVESIRREAICIMSEFPAPFLRCNPLIESWQPTCLSLAGCLQAKRQQLHSVAHTSTHKSEVAPQWICSVPMCGMS